jgi:hypothetical protein
LVSVALYVYRRKVQDRLPLHFRETVPLMPEQPAEVAAPTPVVA